MGKKIKMMQYMDNPLVERKVLVIFVIQCE